jgi:hypothetical protein
LVEFVPWRGDQAQTSVIGFTARLDCMGPSLQNDTVFVSIKDGIKEFFFMRDVAEWREFIHLDKIPSELLPYFKMKQVGD